MTFSHAGMSSFNVMMGGPTMRATFPLDNFFRLEDRVNGEASEVTVEVNPNKIIFLNNKGPNYQPIQRCPYFQWGHCPLGLKPGLDKVQT